MTHDSGRTLEQIEVILAELVDDKTRAALGGDEVPMMVAVELGRLEGDIIETSDQGTVLLSTPWPIVEARLAAVKAARAGGATLDQAIAALPDLPSVH